ncbi:hypothetical protein FHG87_004777 [Trinorchestia longiramus]|nr:hypothetical protein FHG87_004777 [Trinorchestia longiramus]
MEEAEEEEEEMEEAEEEEEMEEAEEEEEEMEEAEEEEEEEEVKEEMVVRFVFARAPGHLRRTRVHCAAPLAVSASQAKSQSLSASTSLKCEEHWPTVLS